MTEYDFGPFTLNAEQLILRNRDNPSVRLTDKNCQVLLVLLENRERRVLRSEIIARVWRNREGEDRDVDNAIAVIRKALSESRTTPTYIKTIRKDPGARSDEGGYWFIFKDVRVRSSERIAHDDAVIGGPRKDAVDVVPELSQTAFHYDVLAKVAALFGTSGATLSDEVNRRTREMTRDSDHARSEKLSAMVQDGAVAKVLRSYYKADDLQSRGLVPYSFSVNGARRDCSLATRPDWVGTSVALGTESERCELTTLTAPTVRSSRSQAVSVLALMARRGDTLWDSEIYRLAEFDIRRTKMVVRYALESFVRYRAHSTHRDQSVHAIVITGTTAS